MGFAWDADDVHLRPVAAEWGMEECSTASTPAASEEFVEVRRGPKMSQETHQFRRGVAWVNDMSLDRPALSACAQNLSRSVARPLMNVVCSELIRYLGGTHHARGSSSSRQCRRGLTFSRNSTGCGALSCDAPPAECSTDTGSTFCFTGASCKRMWR